MARIEVDDSLINHPKIIRLSETLRQPRHASVGMVVNLWLWALENAPDGDLASYSAAAIARGCNWSAKSGRKVLDALKDVGFLEEDLKIHEWEQNGGKILEKRRKHRERNRQRPGQYRLKNTPKPLRADSAQTAGGNIYKPRGMNEYASAGSFSAVGVRPSKLLSPREQAMHRLFAEEMRRMAGDEAAGIFENILKNHDFTREQVITALEYTGRKKARGQVQEPLGYVHQLLLDWDEKRLYNKDQIIRYMSGE